MASNELGLFLADFVAPTNMATDIAAESLVQAVKVNSPTSLIIEISCSTYPDPSLLTSFEQLIAREYSLEHVIISHSVNVEAGEFKNAYAKYCEKLTPWRFFHLQQNEIIPANMDSESLIYDSEKNIYILYLAKTAQTKQIRESIQEFLREHAAALCDVEIKVASGVGKDRSKSAASKSRAKQKPETGKLIWGNEWSHRSKDTPAEYISV